MDDARGPDEPNAHASDEQLTDAVTLLRLELGDSEQAHRRIHELILPALAFVRSQARADRRVVGISAPQGAGKTTLAQQLVAVLPLLSLRGAAVSIDDFYLTNAEQHQLAQEHPGNPYLEHRGYPGTHDIALGTATLDALRELDGAGSVRVPVYDKSAQNGRGDRLPPAQWRTVAGPLDVVLVEGWMLGFEAGDGAPDDPALAVIDAVLPRYREWYSRIDALLAIQPTDPGFVVEWRVEAEEAMKAAGRPGLSGEAVLDYVRRFLPAYVRYGGGVPGTRWAGDRRLLITIGRDRLPVTR